MTSLSGFGKNIRVRKHVRAPTGRKVGSPILRNDSETPAEMQAGRGLADGGAYLEAMRNTGKRMMKTTIEGIIARESGRRWFQ